MAKDNTKGYMTLVNDIKQFAVKPFVYTIHDDTNSLRIMSQHFRIMFSHCFLQ